MLRSFTKYHQQLNVITLLLHPSQTIEILLFDEIHQYFLRCTIKPGQIKGLLGILYENNNTVLYDQLIKDNSALTIINEGHDLYLNFRVKYFRGFRKGSVKLYTQKYLKEIAGNDLQEKVQQSHLQQKHQTSLQISKIRRRMDQILEKFQLANDQLTIGKITFVNSDETWLVNTSNPLLLRLPQQACRRRYDQAKHQRSVQLQLNFNELHEECTQPRYYLALGFFPSSTFQQITQDYDKKKTISIEIDYNKIHTCFYSNIEVNHDNENIYELKNITVSVILNNIQNKIQVYYKLNNQQLNVLQRELTQQDCLGFEKLIPYIYFKESFIHFHVNLQEK